MQMLQDILSQSVVQRIGWTLIHFIWQGALIAFLLAIVLRFLRKQSSNFRYATTLFALAIMTIAPIITFGLTGKENVSKDFSTPAVSLPTLEMTKTVKIEMPSQSTTPITPVKLSLKDRFIKATESLLPHIVICWLAGVVVLSIWYLGGWTQLQKLRRQMVSPVSNEIRTKINRLSKILGISRTVDIFQSVLVNVPTVIGHFKPVILLPASALTGLSGEQIESLLAHELAHIKRCDYLVNILQTVVEILGFYHPAVWWVSNKIRQERENCCDDIAVQITGDEINYAQALATMEEIRFSATENTEFTEDIKNKKLIIAAAGGNLFERIKRLLGKNTANNEKAGWLPSAIVILLIAGLLIPMVLTLSSCTKKKNELSNGSYIDANGHIVDKIDYPFVSDPNVLGIWKSVDFVKEIEHFKPDTNQWTGKLFLREMNFKENGKLISKNDNEPNGFPEKWTKGLVLYDNDQKTASKYIIEEIAGSTYMFYEWKSGDYTIRHMKPSYYILKKVVDGNITEVPPHPPRPRLPQPPPPAPQPVSEVQIYEVNKNVSQFPENDFSSPEAAYAAINKIAGLNNNQKWAAVSVRKLADNFIKVQRDKNPPDPKWIKILQNAQILEVRIFNNARAMVAAELPELIKEPIDVRYFELENGRWLNTGNDRYDKIEQAWAKFAKVAGRTKEQRIIDDKLKETFQDPNEVIQAAQDLFEKIRTANYENILSYYSNGQWKDDEWQKWPTIDYYMVHTAYPDFILWICKTFKDNPIVNVELGKVYKGNMEVNGKTGWPTVPYKLTLNDGSFIQGDLPFEYNFDGGKGHWHGMEGIDWHLQKDPIEKSQVYEVNKSVIDFLDNSGAETGKGDLSSLWFQASVPAEGLKMYRDTENVHSGKYSLAITNTHKYEEIVCNNWAQNIQNIPVGSVIKVSAYIKTENADSANVCIQCWDLGDKNMLAFTTTNTLRGNNNWVLLESPPVMVPIGTVKITVRASLTGIGNVWFDDVKVNTANRKVDDANITEVPPHPPRPRLPQPPPSPPQPVSEVQIYEVNKSVADFADNDFSTPESAYAAINRVVALNDAQKLAAVSLSRLGEGVIKAQISDNPLSPEWKKTLENAQILEVWVWKDKYAAVIAELPQKFSSKPIEKPIDIRGLNPENGKWLNHEDGRCRTLEEAKAMLSADIVDKPIIAIESKFLFVNEKFLKGIKDANFVVDVNQGNLLNDNQRNLLLKMAQNGTDANLLTAPKVTVNDNEGATISVIQSQAYISDYNESSSEPLPKINNIQKGLEFKVLPKLLEKTDLITLALDFEYTDVEFEKKLYKEKYEYQIPNTNVTQILSRVTVADGQTVLLGGKKMKAEGDLDIVLIIVNAQKQKK